MMHPAQLEARRSAVLRLVFVLGQKARRGASAAAYPGSICDLNDKKNLRRFRLALCVLGEPIPTWANRK